jgi:DNA-binding transcriptional regulator GbsR (MarR family)
MDKDVRKKLMDELAKSSQGKALAEYLDEKIKELDTVIGVGTLKELQARQGAVVIVKEVFKFLNKTENKEKNIKNQYL